MNIALAGIAVTLDKPANLAKIAAYAERAARAGARLVVFPEAAMCTFPPAREPLAPHAEALDGPFVTRLRELARAHGVAIVAGMFERAPDPARAYNTLAAVDARGDLAGTYRKVHLYDAFGYRESDRVAPGDGALLTLDVDGMCIGVQTCYDLRFPEITRRLADRGADVVVLPAAWFAGPLKEMHLETLARARAIENTVYFCVADQAGSAVVGNSAVYDPLGTTLAAGGEEEALVVATLSPERIATVRAKLPSLQNRRLAIYANWAEESARKDLTGAGS